MNREIKFRGLRDTESGDIEMVYGQVSMDNNHNCAYYETHPDRIHWRTASGGHASAPVRKGTVGQYIGRKDKNGVEIYCGDIVRVEYDISDEGDISSDYYVGKIVYLQEDAMFAIVDQYDVFIDTLESEVGKSLIFLGNIHQHPELLNS